MLKTKSKRGAIILTVIGIVLFIVGVLLLLNDIVTDEVDEVTLRPLLVVIFSPLLIFAGIRSWIFEYKWDKALDKK